MTDEEVKMAIIEKRWRVWFKKVSFSIDYWHVQRRTWYGGWKTIGSFWTAKEAQQAKEILMREDLATFRGDLSEL